MRSEAEGVRMGIRARLLQVLAAFTAAIGLALSMVLWGAASAPPVAPARADVRPEMQRTADAPRSIEPAAADAGPSPMREAHSDGGYWYWLERRAADAIGTR